MSDTCAIDVIDGVEGPCLAIDDYRIAGPKPWGGGHVIHSWTVSVPLLLGRLHLNEESAHPQRREEQP